MIEALFEETVIRNISSLISGFNRKSALNNFAKLLEIGTDLILDQCWRTISKKCFQFLHSHTKTLCSKKTDSTSAASYEKSTWLTILLSIHHSH